MTTKTDYTTPMHKVGFFALVFGITLIFLNSRGVLLGLNWLAGTLLVCGAILGSVGFIMDISDVLRSRLAGADQRNRKG